MSRHKMARELPFHDVSSARKTIDRAAPAIEKACVARRAPQASGPAQFASVFHAHAPFAWRLLRRLGVADRDAHDVCHDVFVVVHRKLAHIGAQSSIRSFVYGVCVRAASDYRRSARVRLERLSDPMDEADEAWFSNLPDEQVERRLATAFLMSLLERMEETKREVFVLYEMDELTMAEVADIVGCPVQTAYSRLHAARKEIRAAFERREAGEDR
jgi:RNA polymerase sigma-70 factor (ECF subfamily)